MIKTAYILSAGRSGSTLLDLILGTNPEAMAIGEVTHLPKNLALRTTCSCGVSVPECAVWRRVIARMSERLGTDLSQDPYALELGYIGASKAVDHEKLTSGYRALWKLRHGLVYSHWYMGLPPLDPKRFDAAISNTRKLYEVIREVAGVRVVVDSSKNYFKGIGVYRVAPSETRLILLTRDGRASYCSRLRSGFGRERSLKAWQNYYAHALPLIKKQVSDDHVLRVRYEDMTAAPQTEIRRVCEFLNLEFDESMLDFGSVTHHVVNGNRMRLRRENSIRLDNAWESELGTAERDFFEKRAGSLNRRLGYI